jgi:hypothetical protein
MFVKAWAVFFSIGLYVIPLNPGEKIFFTSHQYCACLSARYMHKAVHWVPADNPARFILLPPRYIRFSNE